MPLIALQTLFQQICCICLSLAQTAEKNHGHIKSTLSRIREERTGIILIFVAYKTIPFVSFRVQTIYRPYNFKPP